MATPAIRGEGFGKRYQLLLVILAVALVARVGFAWSRDLNTPPESSSDQEEYDAYAWNLAQGNGYRGPSPDVADQNHPTAYRPPMPSIAMAGVYSLVGHRYDAVRLLHCLFGTASVWLTYRIGHRAYGDRVAILAAAGYAVYPLAVFQSSDILSEPLGVLLFLIFLDLTLTYAGSGKWGAVIGAGVSLGLALLTRANFVLMIPLFVIWAIVQFRSDRRLLGRSLIVLAVASLTLAPWVVRNYLEFGRFIPFSTTGGSALLQGNNRLVVTDPSLFGYNVWDTKLDEYSESLRSAGDEFERDRRAKEHAVEWLRENRDKWGFLVWHKLVRSWTPFLTHNPSAAHRALYLATWGPVLVLFCVAFVPTLVESLRSGSPVWLLHLAVVHYVANSVIFYANIRYRAPVDPICIILAAWVLIRVVQALTRGRAHHRG